MAGAIVVLNAGSSSLKFSVFLDGDPPRPLFRGQLEGILNRPRSKARDADGRVIGDRAGGHVSAWVVPTNEELMIAQHTRRLLSESRS